MTVGTLTLYSLFVLFWTWGSYSIKDILKNRIEDINTFTILWFSTLIVVSFVGILLFLVFYWNYKLF